MEIDEVTIIPTFNQPLEMINKIGISRYSEGSTGSPRGPKIEKTNELQLRVTLTDHTTNTFILSYMHNKKINRIKAHEKISSDMQMTTIIKSIHYHPPPPP